MPAVQKFLFDRSFDDPGARPMRPVGRPPASTPSDADKDHKDRRKGGDTNRPVDDGDNGPAVGKDGGDGQQGPYSGLDRRRRNAAAEAAHPPPDMYTKAQLDAAREEGYIKGHTTALEEAASTEAHISAMALKAITESIDTMDEAQRSLMSEMEASTVRLAMTIARQLLPTTADAVVSREVEALIGGILPELMDQPRLVIRVHGAIADIVRTAVRDLQTTSGYEGRIVVRPDNALSRGDCRLEWGNGGAERDAARVWAEIEAAVARHLDESVPPAPTPSWVDPAPRRGTNADEAATANTANTANTAETREAVEGVSPESTPFLEKDATEE